MNQEEQIKKISQLIAKCWADEDFKQKVLTDPAGTLRAEGMELPEDLSYVAHENTEKVVHLVIPAKPIELSDEELDRATGGSGCGNCQCTVEVGLTLLNCSSPPKGCVSPFCF
jgi:hypothetical protein